MAAHEDNTLDTETLALFANAPERFVRKLRRDGECVVSFYGKFQNGYWKYRIKDKQIRAHRLAFESYHGAIPSDLIVRHTCDNPPCVNPRHLVLGTHKDNARDRDERGRSNTPVGERSGHARLSLQDVRDIRRRVKGGETQTSVAKDYCVGRKAITKIVNFQRWRSAD